MDRQRSNGNVRQTRGRTAAGQRKSREPVAIALCQGCAKVKLSPSAIPREGIIKVNFGLGLGLKLRLRLRRLRLKLRLRLELELELKPPPSPRFPPFQC